MSFSCAGSTLTTLFGSGKKGGADCALGASSEASAAHVACREPLGLAAVVWKLAQQKAQQKAQQTLQEEDGGEKGEENEEPKEDEEDDEEQKEDDEEPKEEDDGEEPKEDDDEEPKEDEEDDEEQKEDEEHEEEIKKDEEEPQEKDDEANQAPKREKQTNPSHAWAPDTALGFFVGAATSDRLPPHEPAVGYFRHGYRHSVASAPVGLVECTSVESAVEAAGGDRLLFPRHDPTVGYFRHNFAPARSAAGFVGEDERDEGGRVGTANNGDSGLKLFFHLCGGRSSSSSSSRKSKSEKL